MSMRILLTGKNGQVGFELQRSLAVLGEVIAVDQTDCDLTDPVSLRRLVAGLEPQIIVNPAAYTAVDRAESERDLAHAVNAVAPGILGEEAHRLGALVIHYSTDYVFDGAKSGWYSEDDSPHPQSTYGTTKLAGERALRESGADSLIFRTSWVFGAHGGNFAKTILRLAGERDELKVVADQWGAPTSAALLADVTAQVVARYQREARSDFPFGLYHLVAGGECSWHDYARTVVSAALAAGKPLRTTPERILPIATADYPTAAKRPANSRMATAKLRETFGLVLPPWQIGLAHVLQQIF